MKQAKKMLCMLLVMLLAFSTVSIGVNAAYTSYANPAGYDLHEKATYTTAQRGSQLLDYVDAMLGDAGLEEIFELPGTLMIDFSSVDKALDSVDDIKGAKGLVGGDVKDLNFNSLQGTRRGTGGKTDLNILYELLGFLNDNRGIVGKFLRQDLDLGLVGSFVELDINVHNLLADMLYEMCVDETYDVDNGAIDYNTWTVDKILTHAVEVLLGGGVAADGDVEEGLIPSLKGKLNINTQTIWQIIELAANGATKDLLIPFIKNDLGALLDEVKAANPNPAWDFIDISKLNIDNYVWGQYDPTNGIVAELNHFLYVVINQVWTGEKFWVDGGNDKLEENLASAIKIVYEELGTLILPASAEFLPQEEIDAMNFQELVSYVAIQFLRSEMPYLLWDTATAGLTVPEDNLSAIACTVAYSILAELPVNSSVYMDDYEFGNIEWNKDTALKMVADIGAYYLNGALPIEINYGEGVEALITKLVNWALSDSNFGGFFAGCGISPSDSPWTKIDKTVFAVLPLHRILGGGATGSYDLIMNKILDNVLNLNLEGILSLLYKDSNGLLNKPAPVFVVTILNNVLNVIVTRNTQPAIFNPNPPSIDSLIQNSNLGASGEKLLNGLYNAGRYEYFWGSLLPILNPLLIDESGYACNQKPAAAGYNPTTSLESLQAYVESIEAAMDEPDDVYDTDAGKWNESVDFTLWRYDQLENAVDEAWGVINGYNGAVEWVAEANERLAAANASGNADEITAAQENLAEAQADLASYNADKYNTAGKNLSYYTDKVLSNQVVANLGDLQYIVYIIEYNEDKYYDENDYAPNVWENYQTALDHAYALLAMSPEAGSGANPDLKQSMVNAARRNLMDAMRLLEIDLADLTALIEKLAEAKAANTEGKTEDSVARLNELIAKAEEFAAGSWIIDYQDEINELVEDLQAAIDGLLDYVAPILPELVEKIEGIKTAISNGIELIYNFATQLTSDALKENFVDSDENGTLEVVKADKYGAYVGTGSELILKDKEGTEVARHTVVIFGDANGDGIVDVLDTILLDLQQAGEGNIVEGSAAWHALNVGGNDKVIDVKDVNTLDAYANFEGELDQSAIVIK
ncbi:MAG: hypothetical protein IKL16_00485 [Clostridia bacterium]|nr:hypothetical protein [Clostridia bacterium]